MARVGGTKYSVFLWFRKKKLQKKNNHQIQTFKRRVFQWPMWNSSRANGLLYTTPEKFENVALFLPLGLPSTLIRHENVTELFENLLQIGGIWKRWLFALVWTEKNGAFRLSNALKIIMRVPFSSFLQTWLVIVAVSNFSGVAWAENIWCVFSEKVPLSNLILQRSMERA